MAKQVIRLTEGDLHRIIKESVKKILREEEEAPYDWRADFNKYHDTVDMSPEEGTALHKRYMDGARKEFGGNEKARIKEFNRLWKEREAKQRMRKSPEQLAKDDLWNRRYNAEHGINVDDFDDDNDVIQNALERAMKKRGASTPTSAPSDSRTMSDDELQARLRDLQAQGMLK